METAIEALRQGDGKLRGSLDLQGADVLSPIPAVHHLVKAEDGEHMVVVLRLGPRDTDACDYEFRLHDPIGWVMMNGKPATDRFAGDPMSSKGVWGRSAKTG